MIRGPASYPEELFLSDRLDLVGKLDRLDLDQHQNATITDYKSGNVFEESSKVHSRYRIQMLAYGLLIHDAKIGGQIRLRLIGLDGTFEWNFDDQELACIRSVLARLARSIPKDVELPAGDLATFGQACRYCRYRPSCRTYRDSAPGGWDRSDFDWLPFDTWGTVERVESDDYVSVVYLVDENKRRVSVRDVPNRLVSQTSRAEFFNLKPLSSIRGGRPANFYVANQRRPDEAAHESFVRFV